MIHEVLRVGPLQCNCHILGDEAAGEAVLIDPGDDAEGILDRIRGLRVTAILHTHGHFDHIRGTRRVQEATGAPILIHRADRALYEGLSAQVAQVRGFWGLDLGPSQPPLPVDGFLEDGQSVAAGGLRLTVLHTPGHTQGSCCFHMEGRLFSGDTLFRRSVGRTDLPGGDARQELDSIRRKLFVLEPETVVYPGHGDSTHIDEEKAQNPFVRG